MHPSLGSWLAAVQRRLNWNVRLIVTRNLLTTAGRFKTLESSDKEVKHTMFALLKGFFPLKLIVSSLDTLIDSEKSSEKGTRLSDGKWDRFMLRTMNEIARRKEMSR
ncbi:hypothetical protein AVEN_191061-1 [Araneus ventricosus]|uniref:Uncharacterized protein n=1 Tax=Araneus ventricosus TaxID=182803 RepID=A0A4Y2AXW2_ARAVE|nr:hypothetical protein AVEN_191061-1 [Araneus ventricosus]